MELVLERSHEYTRRPQALLWATRLYIEHGHRNACLIKPYLRGFTGPFNEIAPRSLLDD